jgi:hypothetical protein
MKNKYEKSNPPSMWSLLTPSVSLSYSPLAGDSYLGGDMDIYEDQYVEDERARKLLPAALAVVITILLAIALVVGAIMFSFGGK